MSETNIESELVYVIYDKSQSVIESWLKDLVTFGFLLFCIWVSQGSTFWIVVCGSMFFVALAGILTSSFNDRQVKLKGKKAAIAWAAALKD